MKFKANQKVTIKGYSGIWEVQDGTPDRDNEIGIWDREHKGWFYVDADDVMAEPKCGEAAALATFDLESYKGATPKARLVSQMGKPLNTQETPTFNLNTEVSNNMSTRNVVTVTLIDKDAGLKPELALVKSFGTQVADGSQADLQMKLVMDNDMPAILAKHNAKRVKEIDLDIRQRTGNEVNLQPVELNQLTWVIVTH